MDRWKPLNEEIAGLVMVTVIEGIFAFLVGVSLFSFSIKGVLSEKSSVSCLPKPLLIRTLFPQGSLG